MTEKNSVALDLSCLLAAALLIVLEDEADLVTFGEVGNAGEFKRRGMNENVLSAGFRSDKSKALGEIEEFHGAIDAHVGSFPNNVLVGRRASGIGDLRIWEMFRHPECERTPAATELEDAMSIGDVGSLTGKF